MPYIIHVMRPANEAEQRSHAVATIEQARDTAVDRVHDRMDAFGEDREALERYGWTSAERAAQDLPEQGGVISLPDGYVVEVAPMANVFGVPDVRSYLHGWHFPASMDDAEIIATYNSEQETS